MGRAPGLTLVTDADGVVVVASAPTCAFARCSGSIRREALVRAALAPIGPAAAGRHPHGRRAAGADRHARRRAMDPCRPGGRVGMACPPLRARGRTHRQCAAWHGLWARWRASSSWPRWRACGCGAIGNSCARPSSRPKSMSAPPNCAAKSPSAPKSNSAPISCARNCGRPIASPRWGR
jgi:hypothetical protein